jgi:hypothetical protein
MPQMLQSRGFQGAPRQTQEAEGPLGGGFLGQLLTHALPLGLGLVLGDSISGGALMKALGGVIGQSAGQAGIGQWGGGQQEEWSQPTNIQAGGMMQAQGPPQQQQQAQAQPSQQAQQDVDDVYDPMDLASSLLEGWGGAGRKA